MNTPKTKWTAGQIAPAPWTWEQDKPLLAADGQLVNGVSRTKEQLAAHRALIALSPELAEALRLIYHDLGKLPPKIFNDALSEEAKCAVHDVLTKLPK